MSSRGSDKGKKYYKNKLKLLCGWIQSQLGTELPDGLISSDDSDPDDPDPDQIPPPVPVLPRPVNVSKKKTPSSVVPVPIVNKESLISECLSRRYIVRLERLSLTFGLNNPSSTKSDGISADQDQVQVKEEQYEEDFLNDYGFDDNGSNSSTNQDFVPDTDTNNTEILKCSFDSCLKRFNNSKDLGLHESLHLRPRPFKCNLCPKAYFTKHKLNRHKLSFHLDNRPELCEICQKRFRDKTQLRVHLYSHSDRRRFKCPYEKCRKDFKTNGALSVHKKLHDKSKFSYNCSKCSKAFPTASTLSRHVSSTIHHKIRIRRKIKKENDSSPAIAIDQESDPEVNEKLKYLCHNCNKGFPNNYKLRRHLISCLKIPIEKTEVCHVCGKAFGDKGQLKRHLTSHSADRPYECDEEGCSKKFKSAVSLRLHKKGIHSGLREYEQCEICGITVSKEHLSNHIRNQHTEGLERFPCDIGDCSKVFKFKNRLSMHKEIVHLIRDPDSRRNWLNMERIFKCDREGCDKSFKYKARLKVHQRSHERAAIKPPAPAFLSISCQLCKSYFANKNVLRYHMKKFHSSGQSDEPVKKYPCSICPRQLSSTGSLRMHMKSHGGEKPLECEFCFKKFLHVTHMKNHRSAYHTKELQQMCSICGLVLSNPVTLKQHMGAIHSEETPHKCHKCDKAFKIKPYLQAHLKVHEDNEKIARGEIVIRKKKKKSRNKTKVQN